MVERSVLGVRAELPVEVPLSLEQPRFYWSRPSLGVRVLGLGEATRREAGAAGLGALLSELTRPGQLEWLDALDGQLPAVPGPWLGAVAFAARQPGGLCHGWEGFGAARFLLPEILCWSTGGRHFAAAFAAADLRPRAEVRALLEARLLALRARLAGPPLPLPEQRALLPQAPAPTAQRQWHQLVTRALDAFALGELTKLVAARSIEVRAAEPQDPRPALLALERRHPTCRIFCLRGDGGAFFLGATPELLCEVEGSRLCTEAVAGTARAAEAAGLLESAKDLREHRWVVEHLETGLLPLCAELTVPKAPSLRRLADLAHLVTPVTGRLLPGVGCAEVVEALHPTPAVAGVPQDAALRFLAAHEGLDRGLYAGPIGLVGEGRAELAVALRSALLRGDRARLFAGAGLVEGSDPAAEWRETELKATAMLSALGAEEARPARRVQQQPLAEPQR